MILGTEGPSIDSIRAAELSKGVLLNLVILAAHVLGLDAQKEPNRFGLIPMPPDEEQSLERRQAAAARYKPGQIDLLLVAEAPPNSPDRYFYFESVREHDSLFRYVCRLLLGREPTRETKPELLEELCERGVFLIDLKETPVDGTPLTGYVPALVNRCCELTPRRIVLIKATVYDAAYHQLKAAGLPVSDVRVPFPGSGRQRQFVETFGRAIAP